MKTQAGLAALNGQSPTANATQPTSTLVLVGGTTLSFGTPTLAGAIADGYQIGQTAQAPNANDVEVRILLTNLASRQHAINALMAIIRKIDNDGSVNLGVA
jgi:hypothetical protein